MSVAEVSAFLDLNKVDKRSWTIVGTSSETGRGIEEGVDFVAFVKHVSASKKVPAGFNPFRS